ncbi:MAG: hypothetical protein PHV34_12385 [Verrucomicrobiae bacterium]|nr:hypothetical protein [Verrucomicrobiae bacterium]
MNAHRFFSGQEKSLIEQASSDAEKRTSAEIVCAVATESGRYDRAESICGLIVALAALALVNITGTEPSESGMWTVGQGCSLGWQSLAVVLGFIAGSTVASCCHSVRRLLVREKEMKEETERAASHVFAMQRVCSTRTRGGLLIYLSLFEKRVVVLADDGILKACDRNFTVQVRDIALKQLAAGKHTASFTDSIRTAAEHLTRVLPVEKDDADELSNRLLIFHPRP